MSTAESSSTLTLPVSEERDHIQGNPDAPVTLVEYGDYQCPYCGAAHPMVKEAQQQLGAQLRFVFRNFPLTTSHPRAQAAAEAAEAAAVQGRFWPMHDLLLENQEHLGDAHLREYAERAGLDVDAFAQELAEHTQAARVREDFMTGVRSGVNGTPAFFINGKRYEGQYDLPTLVAALEDAATEAVGPTT